MTVLIQPYTENAIKQIIRDNKNNFSAPSPSRPKTSFFPLKDQLNDLRQELIEFTVSNPLSITSALGLGERYENYLNGFLAEFQEEGATFDLLNDLVKEAFAEGVLQRTKKEDERRIRAAEAMIADARLYLSVRPNMTYEELLTSTMFQQNLRSANVPKSVCEQLLRDAFAQKPFIYPDEADEKEDQKPEEKKASPTPTLDELEEEISISTIPVVKETTSPSEPSEIPVAAVVASEPDKRIYTPRRWDGNRTTVKIATKAYIENFLNANPKRQRQGWTPTQIMQQEQLELSLRTCERYLGQLWKEGRIKRYRQRRQMGENICKRDFFSSLLIPNPDYVTYEEFCRMRSSVG